MFEPLFLWLETSAVSIWLRESPALFALPGILAAHTVGLGLLAGVNGAINLRLLGVARGIPAETFTRFLPVMWFGLWLNVLTGIALLLAYPTKALTNPIFYLKLGLIGAALAILRATLRSIRAAGAAAHVRGLAVASLATWVAAITTGRLLAYTCTRLTIDSSC